MSTCNNIRDASSIADPHHHQIERGEGLNCQIGRGEGLNLQVVCGYTPQD
jgi:hypothetical protein